MVWKPCRSWANSSPPGAAHRADVDVRHLRQRRRQRPSLRPRSGRRASPPPPRRSVRAAGGSRWRRSTPPAASPAAPPRQSRPAPARPATSRTARHARSAAAACGTPGTDSRRPGRRAGSAAAAAAARRSRSRHQAGPGRRPSHRACPSTRVRPLRRASKTSIASRTGLERDPEVGRPGRPGAGEHPALGIEQIEAAVRLEQHQVAQEDRRIRPARARCSSKMLSYRPTSRSRKRLARSKVDSSSKRWKAKATVEITPIAVISPVMKIVSAILKRTVKPAPRASCSRHRAPSGSARAAADRPRAWRAGG